MTRIDLKQFEKKIKLRPWKAEDYEAVAELQRACFPGMKPWSREQFEALMKAFPEGQVCITYNRRVVASASALVLTYDEYGRSHAWRDVTAAGTLATHDPSGDTLYGIEIMVDPACRGMKLARRLYDYRKDLARKLNLRRILIGGRIPGYQVHAERMSAREYVAKVTDKIYYDPVLSTQLANGFVLKRLLRDYLPSDEESRGWATFMEWPNLDYEPDRDRSLHPYVRVCAIQYQMRNIASFGEFSRHCEYFVDVASDYRCDFILFPEMFTTQLLSFIKPVRPALAMRKLSAFTPQYLELFARLAVKYNINIVGGSHFTIEEDNLYNISYFFRSDGTLGKQYKLHITPSERRWWGVKPGNKVEVFNTNKGKIAILICYDVEFPELARIAVRKGAGILFVPFNTDERRAYLRVRTCAHARCIENQVYAVIAGCVGNLPSVENLDIHYAQSAILTPSDIPFQRDGVAAECSPNIETMIFQDLDLSLLQSQREYGSVLNWQDRRQDLYQLRYKEDEGETEV